MAGRMHRPMCVQLTKTAERDRAPLRSLLSIALCVSFGHLSATFQNITRYSSIQVYLMATRRTSANLVELYWDKSRNKACVSTGLFRYCVTEYTRYIIYLYIELHIVANTVLSSFSVQRRTAKQKWRRGPHTCYNNNDTQQHSNTPWNSSTTKKLTP